MHLGQDIYYIFHSETYLAYINNLLTISHWEFWRGYEGMGIYAPGNRQGRRK